MKKTLFLVTLAFIYDQSPGVNISFNDFYGNIQNKTKISYSSQNFGTLKNGNKIAEGVFKIAISACAGYLCKDYNGWENTVFSGGKNSFEDSYNTLVNSKSLAEVIKDRSQLNTYCLIKFLHTDTFAALSTVFHEKDYAYTIPGEKIFTQELDPVLSALANPNNKTVETPEEKNEINEIIQKIKEETIEDIKWYVDKYRLIDLYAFLKQQKVGNLTLPEKKSTKISVGGTTLGSGRIVAPGITNVGNTCYLNAGLQAIFASPTIRNTILSKYNNSDLSFVSRIFKELSTSKSCISSDFMRKAISDYNSTNPSLKIAISTQEDSFEHLQKYFFERIKENDQLFEKIFTFKESGRSSYSFIILNIVRELVDKNQSSNISFNLANIFDKSLRFSDFVDNNLFPLQGVVSVQTLPQVLVLYTLRIYGKKYDNSVFFPEDMILQDDNGVYKYRLYSVVNHSGTGSGGHYYAYVRGLDDKYYKQNDGISNLFDNKELDNDNPFKRCVFFVYEKVEEWKK